MAGLTPRFGFNFFGGDTDGTLDDDADKFTGEDRLMLDTLLAALERHDHRPNASVDAPTGELTLDVADEPGMLEGGTTYYYCVSMVNSDGLETVAGPEQSITTPALLDVPEAPQAETAVGGTLREGQYYYGLTALTTTPGGAQQESILSDLVSVTVTDDEGTVILALPDLGNADELQVWRADESASKWTRVGTSATDTFTDDGSVPDAAYNDPENTPPEDVSAEGTYAVVVTLDSADAANAQDGAGWRIYRTTVSGAYSAASLVHEVVERVDETDPDADFVTEWVDTGDVNFTGSPKVSNQQMQVKPFTFEVADPLPDPTTSVYPVNYPIVDGAGTFYIKRGTSWQAISGGWRGVAVWTGTGEPDPEPTGSQAGDLYIDLDNGDLYTLDGS